MINQTRYRRDYTGEFLIYNVSLGDGTYEEEREWIPNTIENNDHYGTAVIIGNGESRKSFNLSRIKNHRTGRGGVNRMQSYGCNALYRDFDPDFLVATNPKMVNEISENATLDSTMLMTSPANLLEYPGKYHLIPYGVNMNAGATATYLACFDGHTKVYLLGFDNQTGERNNNIYSGTECYDDENAKTSSAKWELAMWSVFQSYPNVIFTRVDPQGTTPNRWKSCLNYRTITSRQFALETDL